MRISVLGAGSWGTTLAVLLVSNSHDVVLWSYEADQAAEMEEVRENLRFLPGITLPQALRITHDPLQAVQGAELIVAAVPAQFIRGVAVHLAACDFSKRYFVNVAKGIENTSLMTMSEVLQDCMPTVKRDNIITLSGPSFAEEVARRIPTAVVAASTNLATARLAQETFMTPYFRVYSSCDLRGVELGGSIKNVIAVGAGIADGAGFGDNTKAAIMTRGTAELSRLGIALGADAKTFAGLSGIGDLILTCMSKKSRNRHVGEEIGKGRKLNDILGEMVMVAEGVATTKSVYNLAKLRNVELPIVNEVYEVLFQGKDPIAATSDLMTRDAKGEN
jgi:glycerol-3-phosphate dehydrogenase (NAD(P)+)